MDSQTREKQLIALLRSTPHDVLAKRTLIYLCHDNTNAARMTRRFINASSRGELDGSVHHIDICTWVEWVHTAMMLHSAFNDDQSSSASAHTQCVLKYASEYRKLDHASRRIIIGEIAKLFEEFSCDIIVKISGRNVIILLNDKWDAFVNGAVNDVAAAKIEMRVIAVVP